MTGEQNSAPEEAKVFFRVESGNPSPEELAALTVVLAAAASDGDDEPMPKSVDGWAHPARRMRSVGVAGRGGWRAEYAPR